MLQETWFSYNYDKNFSTVANNSSIENFEKQEELGDSKNYKQRQ